MSGAAIIGGSVSVSGQAQGAISLQPGTILYGEISLRGGGGPKYPEYDGEYEADALLEQDQTFPTRNMIMKQDMLFKGMKVRIITNPAGGLTYYI